MSDVDSLNTGETFIGPELPKEKRIIYKIAVKLFEIINEDFLERVPDILPPYKLINAYGNIEVNDQLKYQMAASIAFNILSVSMPKYFDQHLKPVEIPSKLLDSILEIINEQSNKDSNLNHGAEI
jgi:hypothetical protein